MFKKEGVKDCVECYRETKGDEKQEAAFSCSY